MPKNTSTDLEVSSSCRCLLSQIYQLVWLKQDVVNYFGRCVQADNNQPTRKRNKQTRKIKGIDGLRLLSVHF